MPPTRGSPCNWRAPSGFRSTGEIQAAYAERGRSDGLAEDTYSDPNAIFDIMGITVIHHLHAGQLQPPSL
jgi:hypothetical protein